MKMKMIFSILLTLSISLPFTTVQANDCAKVVHLKGTVDNNAVTPATSTSPFTMGVANLTYTTDKNVVDLTCALLGEPTGQAPSEQNPGPVQTYYHKIVCNDKLQSELSFKTYAWYPALNTDLTAVLSNSEIHRFCTKDDFPSSAPYAAFEEAILVDPAMQSKGLFKGASNLEDLDESIPLRAAGCVNTFNYYFVEGLGYVPGEMRINMEVEGDLCFPE